MNPTAFSKRRFLWESSVLGVFGALAGAVVGKMTAGVLNSANVQVPLSVQLLLASDTFTSSELPAALAGAIALIGIVTAIAGSYPVWRAPRPCELTLSGPSSHGCARIS